MSVVKLIPLDMRDDREFNIRFISEVKKRRVLYDPSIEEYANRDVTFKTWKEIAKVLSTPDDPITGEECKFKWKNIRGSYRKHLGFITGSSSKQRRRGYYLSPHLEFVLPFIKLNERSDKTLSPPESSMEESEDVCLLPNDLENDIKEEESEEMNEDEEENSMNPNDYLTTSCKIMNGPSKKRKTNESMKDLRNSSYRNLQEEDPHGFSSFFMGLLPEVQDFTPSQRRRCKSEVLNVVLRIAEENEYNFPEINNG